MITLFIFKSSARGMQFGIGTYIRELIDALLKTEDIMVYLISYKDSSIKEFKIIKISERYFQIRIPLPCFQVNQSKDFDKKYATAVTRLLSDFIPHSNAIFHMNYIDDLPLIEILKERYPHPVVSILHFFQWEQLFNGNIKKMESLNFDDPSNNIEYTIHTEKRMFEISDHVVAINSFMRDFLILKYNLQTRNISLIRNGINFEKFSKIDQKSRTLLKQKLGFNEHEKIILFSGRIDPDKGVFFLLDAFIESCKARDDLRLVLIGQGSIQELMKKYTLYTGKITFTGYLPFERILEYYQIADIGVVPSIYEPCSYSRLEMIASGIPLILSKIEGFNEMTADQCLFIDPCISAEGEISFRVDEFCNALLCLAGDVRKAGFLSENAYKSLIDLHSASTMAEKMRALYYGLLN